MINLIKIDSDLKDMIISALRYAIGRKTYITFETCTFIKEHPKLIDERVKHVMLRDLRDIDMYYNNSDTDYRIFLDLMDWLRNLEVSK